jgi:hypothetical protein
MRSANENAVKALRRIVPHDPIHLAAISVNGGMIDAWVFADLPGLSGEITFFDLERDGRIYHGVAGEFAGRR